MDFRPLITIAFILFSSALTVRPAFSAPIREPSRQIATDKFAIYTSTPAGSGQVLIASDPKREINHSHISPDGSHVVFTRYNTYNNDGVAAESNGYFQTEIVICAASGANCVDVVPARSGVIAANASWMPDGKNILFICNGKPGEQVGIYIYNLANSSIKPFFTPSSVSVADPVFARSGLVVSGMALGKQTAQLFLVSSTRNGALTNPQFSNPEMMDPALGDYDPKFSPDGATVAFMRHNPSNYSIVTINIKSGIETELSPPHGDDAMPEWSSDGKTLIFWHIDATDPKLNGIYTMTADGKERKQVPLPLDCFYSSVSFVPGAASASSSRIIYSRQR